MAEPQFLRVRENAYLNLAEVAYVSFMTVPADAIGPRCYVTMATKGSLITIDDAAAAETLRRWIAERTVK